MTTDTTPEKRGRGVRLSPETRQAILADLKAGKKVKVIAAAHHVTLPTVYVIKHKLDALQPGQALTP